MGNTVKMAGGDIYFNFKVINSKLTCISGKTADKIISWKKILNKKDSLVTKYNKLNL